MLIGTWVMAYRATPNYLVADIKGAAACIEGVAVSAHLRPLVADAKGAVVGIEGVAVSAHIIVAGHQGTEGVWWLRRCTTIMMAEEAGVRS